MFRQASSAFRRQVKSILEATFGVRIYIGAHGHDECTDIKAAFGDAQIRCIFDVGANVGQSARKFMAAFPKADIYCFEPVIACFNQLTAAVAANRRVHCQQIALGNADTEGTLYLTKHTMRSSLIRPADTIGTQPIVVRTLDTFCREAQVAAIDFLKIDTEGNDLAVLQGSESFLKTSQVPFILAEVGFHPNDDRKVLFDDVRDFLMPFGYHLFGIYDQNLEWNGKKQIQFANACFCNGVALAARSMPGLIPAQCTTGHRRERQSNDQVGLP